MTDRTADVGWLVAINDQRPVDFGWNYISIPCTVGKNGLYLADC